MTSQKHQEISALPSEVSKFYEGKSVFITGGSGFVGSVLLEILLRCCPDIRRIYLLLRPKKGVLPDERKKQVLNKDIFRKIKERNPDVQEKLIVVPGDIANENLGMSEDDLHKVTEEVSIVFHIAASISFLKPLSYMLQYNLVSTNTVIELCRKLKKLDVLVYTSTAYSNCNRKYDIDEIVYKLPFKAKDVLDLTIRNGSEEDLMAQFNKCKPAFPNFYTYSKNLSENLLQEKASDLPVVIVRPSLISWSWKGIVPGYLEDNSGIASIGLGVGKGFLRVYRLDREKYIDFIPVDITANTHIVAAWIQVKERLPSPYVYNCTSSETIRYTWDDIFRVLLAMVKKHPIPGSYQNPSITLCTNPVKYWTLTVLDHFAPALVIDAFLSLSGRKPRLFKLYMFLNKITVQLKHFTLTDWFFYSRNFRNLSEKINATDTMLFHVDLKDFRLENTSESLVTGAPMYQTQNGKKPSKKGIHRTFVYYFLTPFIKWSLVGGIAALTYAAIF